MISNSPVRLELDDIGDMTDFSPKSSVSKRPTVSPVTRLTSKQSLRSVRSVESLPASPTRVFATELLGVLWWTGAYTVHQNVLIGNVVKGDMENYVWLARLILAVQKQRGRPWTLNVER